MNLQHLIVDLQSLGVRVPATGAGRRGGAGPAEGQAVIIEGRCCNVPTNSWYVAESPYCIGRHDEACTLYRNDDPVCAVTFPDRPRYYDLTTPEGISLEKIALIHGCDCLASTVHQDCAHWNTPQQCRFCGIGLSLESGATIRTKPPADLAFTAAMAQKHDAARHVTLTTGAWFDERAGAGHLTECVHAIKQATGLPVHVQICPPERMDVIDRLRHAGADTLGIHIETAGALVLEQVAPAKAAMGLKTYINCWEHAVAAFGKNQVSSFLIAGLGETPQKIINAADLLCGLGVFPYLLPLRPIPGTPLAGARPPEPGVMLSLYQELAGILKKYGLSSKASKAGCVRCGACSALGLFEEGKQETEDRSPCKT